MYKPWNNWPLSEWLRHLEHRTEQEIQLGLARISAVAKKLNLDKPKCPVITVGGTNGKGSTVAALESFYHSAGYRVGAYTSPHLQQFNERIRLNLQPISDEYLCQALGIIEEARGEVFLTYFEMTTLAALYYVQQHPIDVLILEVGLGGRLDATNIVDADVAIITTIDLDHQDYLGTTLDAIGYEKAGILRTNKPFIYADLNPPETILSSAQELGVQKFMYGVDFSIEEEASTWSLHAKNDTFELLPIPKIQLKSAAAALMAVHILDKKLPVSRDAINRALNKIYIPGRLELISGSVAILFDVAHNAQSARLLAHALQSLHTTGKVHAVFSALKDKDISGLIAPLKNKVDYWYPALLNNKRALSADALHAYFEKEALDVKMCYDSPISAFQMARKQANPGDLIVVYGSFYTVGQVMSFHYNTMKQKEIL